MAFDAALRPLKDFSELTLDGEASAMRDVAGRAGAAISRPADRRHPAAHRRQRHRPGGRAKSTGSKLPPVYPVALGAECGLVDVSVARVSVTSDEFRSLAGDDHGRSRRAGHRRPQDRRPRARRSRQGAGTAHAGCPPRRRAARAAVSDQARAAGHQLLHGAGVPGRRRGRQRRPHGRGDAGQQSPPGDGRSRRRTVSRAVCRRPGQLGIQVPRGGPWTKTTS